MSTPGGPGGQVRSGSQSLTYVWKKEKKVNKRENFTLGFFLLTMEVMDFHSFLITLTGLAFFTLNMLNMHVYTHVTVAWCCHLSSASSSSSSGLFRVLSVCLNQHGITPINSKSSSSPHICSAVSIKACEAAFCLAVHGLFSHPLTFGGITVNSTVP